MGRHDSDCGNTDTLKRVPLRCKKLRPDPAKVYGFGAVQAAISRNFPQLCLRNCSYPTRPVLGAIFPSWRRLLVVMSGLVPPARPQSLRRGEGQAIHVFHGASETWMAGSSASGSDAIVRTAMPGHDVVEVSARYHWAWRRIPNHNSTHLR